MRMHTLAVGSAVTVLALLRLSPPRPPRQPPPPTPPAPISIDYDPGRTVVARANGVRLKINQDATVRTTTLTYAVRGQSGWHEHPGIVIALVKSGTVERQLGCRKAVTYTAGEAFTEYGLHLVRNPGTVPAVLEITAIYPADTEEDFRQDRDEPKCRSQAELHRCRRGGVRSSASTTITPRCPANPARPPLCVVITP